MLNELGEKLVKCNLNCDGVNNNPKEGIIPRCLIQEKRRGDNTCIIVGLNPGKCNKKEKSYYLSKGIRYDSIPGYFFDSNLHNHPYFKRTRDFVTLLGFDGDILWTDLAKCECLGENGTIPIQTLRVCINKFLREEIKVFECTSIFALGNVAFDFCALSFPTHFIVGIPHPTGSHGDFGKLNKRIASDPQYFIQKISDRQDSNGNYRAIHLSKI